MDGLDSGNNNNNDLDDHFSDDTQEDGIAPGSGSGDDTDAFMDAEDSDGDNDGGFIDTPVVNVPLQSNGGGASIATTEMIPARKRIVK